MKNYIIGFYLEKLYYSPQFEPVIKELIKRDISYVVIIPQTRERDEINQREESIKYCQQKNFTYCNEEDDCTCNIMIFGNTPRHIQTNFKKSAIINHGVWGGKAVYLAPGLNNVDLRFLDSEFMEECLKELFPEKKSIFYVVGYSKLDSYFELTEQNRIKFLQDRNLDINKKTILYAPTFYPSSVLKMGKRLPEDLSEYNIILKPHSHLFLRKKYKKDLQKIQSWAKYPNVYLANFNETNILPFFQASDLLISDISSAVFEFSGLGKPAIINMFLKYRFIDRIFPYRINRRLDTGNFHLWKVGDTPQNYQQMLSFARENLNNPDSNKIQREQLSRYVVGNVDGKVSERIVNKLMELNVQL